MPGSNLISNTSLHLPSALEHQVQILQGLCTHTNTHSSGLSTVLNSDHSLGRSAPSPVDQTWGQ